MLSRAEAFAAAPLFAGLSPEITEALAERATSQRLDTGETLFRAGQIGTSVCVVLDGEVEVQIEGPRGRDLILALAGPGSNLGELSVLDEGTRSATVIATMPTEVLILPREEFTGLLHADQNYMAAVLKMLAGMIRMTNQRLAELAVMEPSARLARALLNLAQRDGIEKDGKIRIDRQVTEVELAAMTALYLPEVERLMRDLQLNDVLLKDGDTLTILRKEALEWAVEDV